MLQLPKPERERHSFEVGHQEGRIYGPQGNFVETRRVQLWPWF